MLLSMRALHSTTVAEGTPAAGRTPRSGLKAGLAALFLAVTSVTAVSTSPVLANELRIALTGGFSSLDPHTGTAVATELSVASHIYSALTTMGPDHVIAPSLALSWKTVNDTTWRFELRPDVKFPDGEPVDPDTVAWNIKRIQDPATKSANANRYKLITDVHAAGPTTVEIVTSSPFPALPAQLSMLFIMPPKWTAEHNPAIEASGTGPYELVEFAPGDHVTLKARADYWGTKPDFSDVTFRMIPEPAARVAGLLAGELDLVTGFPTTEIARINDSGRATADAIPSNRAAIVKFNNLVEPFKGNTKLRQALNYAIDKKTILDSIWQGYGSLSNCQVLNEQYFGFNPDLQPVPYDSAKAKQLLAEAGFPNGMSVEMEIPRGRYLSGEEISQVIVAQLEEIGVHVKIVEREFSTWLQNMHTGKMLQMNYFGTAWPTLDADGQLTAFQPGDPDSYYENEDFKKYVDEGRSSVDPEQRKLSYKKATEAMCSDPPVIFLFNQPTTYGESKSVSWSARGDDWMRAYDVKAN
jgi:peptide/nickel transport system substrate-binding protein